MEHFIVLAFKNVFRQKKRSFTLGVNYAVVAFILVLLMAFSHGASVNIADSLVKATAGHITITGQFAKGGKIYNGLSRTPDIVSAVTDTYGDAKVLVRYLVRSTLYFNGLSKRLSFTGIDTGKDPTFQDQAVFKNPASDGSWSGFAQDPNGVLMPQDTANYFGLKLGDQVVLSTRTRFGAFNTGILTVRGIYTTDNYFAKDLVLTHFDFLRNLDLADPTASTAVYVYFPRVENLSAKRDIIDRALKAKGFDVAVPTSDTEAIAAVSAASPKYETDKEGRDRVMLKVATLDEVLGLVRTILAAVNAVGALISLVMLFIIAVSIFINLKMNINERLMEIGTMRALGIEGWRVTVLFILESVSLALVFSILGGLLAVGASALIRIGPTFPPGGNLGIFLQKGHLVLLPTLGSFISVILVIGLFAALFSFFPARKGGAIPPVAALTKTF